MKINSYTIKKELHEKILKYIYDNLCRKCYVENIIKYSK